MKNFFKFNSIHIEKAYLDFDLKNIKLILYEAYWI